MAKSTLDKMLSFNPKREIGWWLFKRSLKTAFTRGSLALSAVAAGVGIGFWAPSFDRFQALYVVAGIIAGLIILVIALSSLFKFKATAVKSLAILLLGCSYLAASLYYILNGGVI